jgi:transcriptional regulator with XRE-family HTH domain
MELYMWLWKRRIHGRDFAKKIGICEQTVSNLANRQQSPSLLTATKIHEATGGEVSYDDLLDEMTAIALAGWRADNANVQ